MRLFIFALLLSFPHLAFADSPAEIARKSFWSNSEVQAAIQQLKSEGFTIVAPQIQNVTIGNICGFAGCDNEFLVVILLTNPTAQNLGKSVKATVKVRVPTNYGISPRVNLVELSPIN